MQDFFLKSDLNDKQRTKTEKMYHPNIALSVNPTSTNEAHILLKPDSEEYFRVASQQISVYPLPGSGRTYADILSAQGLALFQEAQRRYQENDVKDKAIRYSIQNEHSGSWFKPQDSPFSWINYEDEGEIKGMFNTRLNMCITGEMEKAKRMMTTSICVFITDEWCLTKSGSVYKLGEKVPQ